MSRRLLVGDLLQVVRRHSYVGALLLLCLLAACASLPQRASAPNLISEGAPGAWYCSTTYPVQCELPPAYGQPQFYRVQLGGGGISGYPLNITSPSNDECLLLQGPPWVIVNGSCSGSSSTAWANITGGTNTTAAMLVGAGASLAYTSTGVVDANEINGLTFPTLVSSDCLTNNGTALSWGSCGSGGTPGGTSGEVQYNNSSAFGGIANVTDGVLIGQSSGAPEFFALSGDCTITSAGAITCLYSSGNPTITYVGTEHTYGVPYFSGTTALTSLLPGSTGTYCFDWTSLSAAPTLTSSCGSGGITLQTNGTNNSSQTALNIENGQGIACSNPSSGNVQCVTTQPERTVTGTSDTISCTTDSGGMILYNSSSAVAVTVPEATGSCAAGFAFTVENSGSADATLTPTTSTIQGLSSLVIPTNQGCSLWSDGTNYQVAACRALSTLTYAEGSVTTVTPDCAFGTTTATITGAATIDTPTGCTPYNGQRIFLEIQSASSETYTASGYLTGSTTGSWPASSTGSSKDDHFELIYDGYLSSPGWTLAAYNLGL